MSLFHEYPIWYMCCHIAAFATETLFQHGNLLSWSTVLMLARFSPAFDVSFFKDYECDQKKIMRMESTHSQL